MVIAYTRALLVISLVDFGYNGAGQTLFRGLLLGMLVFLVASGLSLIFGLLDVLNFAQGAFLLIGAYVGYDVYTSVDASTGRALSGGDRSAAWCLSPCWARSWKPR